MMTKLENKQIFYKPSHTDINLYYISLHLCQQKLASYDSMVHRLVTIEQSE